MYYQIAGGPTQLLAWCAECDFLVTDTYRGNEIAAKHARDYRHRVEILRTYTGYFDGRETQGGRQ